MVVPLNIVTLPINTTASCAQIDISAVKVPVTATKYGSLEEQTSLLRARYSLISISTISGTAVSLKPVSTGPVSGLLGSLVSGSVEGSLEGSELGSVDGSISTDGSGLVGTYKESLSPHPNK